MQGAPQRVDEVAVPDHARGGEVVDALERMLERVEVGRDDVVERDPAPPLRPAPDAAADPQAERQQHPLQRTAVLREDESLTEVHDPRAGGAGRVGSRLPLPDDVGEEPLTRRGLLGQLLVAALPVVAHRRGEEQRRPGIEARDGLREQSRAVHARVANAPLRFGCPPLIDAVAGEVHDRGDVRERILVDRARGGIPGRLVGRTRARAGRAAGRRGPPREAPGRARSR